MLEWRDRGVGYHIVHAVSAGGSGKTQVADLDRSRAVREDAKSRVLGKALEVHQDVNAGVGNALGHFAVAELTQIMKRIES